MIEASLPNGPHYFGFAKRIESLTLSFTFRFEAFGFFGTEEIE
jgi:hypothetical protein